MNINKIIDNHNFQRGDFSKIPTDRQNWCFGLCINNNASSNQHLRPFTVN